MFLFRYPPPPPPPKGAFPPLSSILLFIAVFFGGETVKTCVDDLARPTRNQAADGAQQMALASLLRPIIGRPPTRPCRDADGFFPNIPNIVLLMFAVDCGCDGRTSFGSRM